MSRRRESRDVPTAPLARITTARSYATSPWRCDAALFVYLVLYHERRWTFIKFELDKGVGCWDRARFKIGHAQVHRTVALDCSAGSRSSSIVRCACDVHA